MAPSLDFMRKFPGASGKDGTAGSAMSPGYSRAPSLWKAAGVQSLQHQLQQNFTNKIPIDIILHRQFQ